VGYLAARRIAVERSNVTKIGPGFVGFGADGRFLHYCHCGRWGGWGFNVNRAAGELGQWYCDEHRPKKEGASGKQDGTKGTAPARDA
jgi:hypothetical protein